MPHQKEGTELEEQERLFRGPTRLIAAAVIAAVIVMMSALLAFITVPPQPLVLLLGILVAQGLSIGLRGPRDAPDSPPADPTRSNS